MKIHVKLLPKAERQRKPFSSKLLVFIILAWLTNAILAFIAWSFARGDQGVSAFMIGCSVLIAAVTGLVLFRQRSQTLPEALTQQPGAPKILFWSIGDVLLWIAAVGGVLEIVLEFFRMA